MGVCVCHLKKQPQNKSVFSFLRTYALETFLTTTLYKSTFTIPYYNNVALPASHAFANRCCCKLSSNRSISPARWAHSSKPAAADFLLWAHAGTDRRTDTVPSHRSCSGLVMQAHSHPFNGPLSGTTRVSRYQKGKTSLDFTAARNSEWQWHQLGHMQVCTSLQTDNHASTPPLFFLQAGCPSCRPTNSVKAIQAMPAKVFNAVVSIRTPQCLCRR